jgi:hypothetical protein
MFKIFAIVALLFEGVAAKTGDDHPTLPTMWSARTIDPPQGKGIEKYFFMDTPTDDTPSGMWSEYLGCKRLISTVSLPNTKRYLLGCDGGVDCCWEEQSGNQVEFQIPNVHYTDPTKKVPVDYARANITNFGEVIEADAWSWKFTTEKFTAYTNDCPDCVNGVQLLQWKVDMGQETKAVIQFKGYQGIDPNTQAGKDFAAEFAVPQQCLANNLLKCS